MGYRIYIPISSYNPLSYDKIGCPIWIRINDEGTCHVILQEIENNLENEVTDYISKNLPKLPILHCCTLSTSLQRKAGLLDADKYDLNCACVDENNNLHAYVIVGDGVIEDDVVILIKDLWYDNKKALSMLRDYLLREENVTKYRSKEIWHSQTNSEIIEILHFLDRGNGLYSWQLE